jgi:quercetin dioxygenase-like cupin family protein
MAISHANSGDVVAIGPLGPALAGSITHVLVKSPTLEVIRLVVPAGKGLSEHKAPGDMTVQCLEGAVDFTAEGKTQRLVPGQLLYLAAGAPHALHGVQDASVLLTILLR